MAGIAVFGGSCAALAPEVCAALDRLGLDYDVLGDLELLRGGLERYRVLVFPGGYTFECLKLLRVGGSERIRRFVEGGGGYVGICAGAYVAPHIGLTRGRMIRMRGTYVETIFVVDERHPVVRGFRGEVRMHYQNGPHMVPSGGDHPIALFRDDTAAIMECRGMRRRVILFSTHPEMLPETTPMLRNAVEYCTAGIP